MPTNIVRLESWLKVDSDKVLIAVSEVRPIISELNALHAVASAARQVCDLAPRRSEMDVSVELAFGRAMGDLKGALRAAGVSMSHPDNINIVWLRDAMKAPSFPTVTIPRAVAHDIVVELDRLATVERHAAALLRQYDAPGGPAITMQINSLRDAISKCEGSS